MKHSVHRAIAPDFVEHQKRIDAMFRWQDESANVNDRVELGQLEKSLFRYAITSQGAELFGPLVAETKEIAAAARELRAQRGKIQIVVRLVPPAEAKLNVFTNENMYLVNRLHDGFRRGLIEIGAAEPYETFGGGGMGSDWRAVLVDIGRRAIRYLAGVDAIYHGREPTTPMMTYRAAIAEELLFGTRALTVAMRAGYHGIEWTMATCIESMEQALADRPSRNE
jgi:hypothetical protein